MTKRSKKLILRSLLIFLILLFSALSYTAWELYKRVYQPNVVLESGRDTFIYIRTGWKFEDVKNMLYEKGLIRDRNTFEWLCEQKNYITQVRPGKYKVYSGMSNNDLVNLLRSGKQTPVRLSFHNIRYKPQLSGRIGKIIEADSTELLYLLNDEEEMQAYGFTSEQALAMLIPNTYEVYWNTSAREFLDRMHREYKNFWTKERLDKAEKIPLSPVSVSILASIVESETTKWEEMSRIAGVYINRLRKGMLLQADPTARYAANDPSIKRVLRKHLSIDSPYNTYIYPGLPPGPICMPSPITIDKVLNFEKHEYIYFCAKEDFSGYHVFAKTLAQHELNAAKYRRELNRRNIR